MRFEYRGKFGKWLTLAWATGALAVLTTFQWAPRPQANETAAKAYGPAEPYGPSEAELTADASSLGGTTQAAGTAAPRGGDPDGLAIIDAHTHTDFTGKPELDSTFPHSKEEYLRQMKEAGVVGAVSHTTRHLEGYDESLQKEHNVVFCGGVDAKVDVARLEEGLRSGKLGCLKIYLGYVHQWAYDPAYEPAYKLAEKYSVPVVFHTGDTSTKDAKVKYADPLTIDEVAVDHPKVNFVIAHCGNPWIQSAAEVAYKNDNVYMECSALMIGSLKNKPKAEVDEYVAKPIRWIWGYIENPKKLMFGTDFPLMSMKEYIEAYKRGIPREYWRAVFHDNAVRVFKLK